MVPTSFHSITEEELAEAGVRAIIINSSVRSACLPARIFAVKLSMLSWVCSTSVPKREFFFRPPIVVVPTSFHSITEEELAEAGVNLVIYANQLTRSALGSAMYKSDSQIKQSPLSSASLAA